MYLLNFFNWKFFLLKKFIDWRQLLTLLQLLSRRNELTLMTLTFHHLKYDFLNIFSYLHHLFQHDRGPIIISNINSHIRFFFFVINFFLFLNITVIIIQGDMISLMNFDLLMNFWPKFKFKKIMVNYFYDICNLIIENSSISLNLYSILNLNFNIWNLFEIIYQSFAKKK